MLNTSKICLKYCLRTYQLMVDAPLVHIDYGFLRGIIILVNLFEVELLLGFVVIGCSNK